ncbi:MAG: type II toxin-antitoxin system prevent-host-death family antitoxin [Pseudomonadota bacterium]
MHAMSYSSFRSHLASTLDKVNEDHKPIMITRQNGKPAVIISLEDFQSYEETSYLMASPKNAHRLNEAIEQIESSKSKQHDLIEK